MRVVTQNLWGWYYPLEGRGTGRARPGAPRPAAWSARRVLVRCAEHGPSLDITACARLFDRPVDGVWASDHFGVVADLAVAPPEPMVRD